MIPRAVTHVGFSDESNWNKGRFRSLGLVTAPVNYLAELEQELRQLFAESGIGEFGWKKLVGARERFAAQKMCSFAVKAACARKLRVDVLIWDTQDSRHKIKGRDDIANLQRMYYHLFRNVLRARWPGNAIWRLYPDEHTAMDWNAMQDLLENVAERFEVEHSLFTQGKFRVRLRREFGLKEIQSVSSHEHPLLQLADLFAGMAVFSKEKFDDYQAWLSANSNQSSLFEDDLNTAEPSHSSRERFSVLQYFDKLCKKHKLGVSLKTNRGLWTAKPENWLNFWVYEPQHPEDRAPKKSQR